MLIFSVLAVILGGFFYWRSVKSRKTYRCEACDEPFTGELMEASRCSVCGAPLKQTGGKQ